MASSKTKAGGPPRPTGKPPAKGGGAAGSDSARRSPRALISRYLCGFAITLLAWVSAVDLGMLVVPVLRWPPLEVLVPAFGGLLAFTRFQRFLWWFAIPVSLLFVLVGRTPWATTGVRGLVREDPLRKSPAVLVLSSDIRRNGELDQTSRFRLLHGIEVLQQGYADTLVITRLERPKRSYLPAIRKQFKALAIDYPVVETGEVRNTHDEAVQVAALCRERGWERIILVSDPTHMRRAQAVFRKAGVNVLCSPAEGIGYHPELLGPGGHSGMRLMAFRDWVYELIGYEVYRLRGWI